MFVSNFNYQSTLILALLFCGTTKIALLFHMLNLKLELYCDIYDVDQWFCIYIP